MSSEDSHCTPDRVTETDVFQYERTALSQGFRRIAGLDEAGRGPLAGPVVAAAVVFHPGIRIEGVDDSKKLTDHQRETLFRSIRKMARSIGIGLAGNTEIDTMNILEATRLAMRRAVGRLSERPDCLLIDALRIPCLDIHQVSIIKGDQLSHSIAAASIVAKVVRDRIMHVWHKHYPQYDWKNNKGYGTTAHLSAIKRFGPSPLHRFTFHGVRQYRGLFETSDGDDAVTKR